MADMEIESDEENIPIIRKKKIQKTKTKKPQNIQIKATVEKVLEELNFSKSRSQKLHWSEFLEMMNCFNKNGIFFN